MSNQLIISPSDLCTWCQQRLGEEEELVLVESGQVKPMKKDPQCLMFIPDWKSPEAHLIVSITVHVFHFQCYYDAMTRLGLEWYDRISDRYCASCYHDFKNDRWAFRCTVGGIGRHLEFEVDINIPRPSIMCVPCTTALFGHGDKEEGDARIHKHLDK